jgi:hypothetical protein
VDEVRIYPSRVKLVSFAVAGAVLSVLGAILALAQPIGPAIPVAARAVGWIAVATFGTLTFWLVVRLARRRPLLVVSGDGITDRSSAVGAGFIAWTEIEEVRLAGARPHRFLAVVPKDPRTFIAARPWRRRLVFRMNRLFGFPMVAVSAAWFPMRLEEVLAQLREANPDFVKG